MSQPNTFSLARILGARPWAIRPDAHAALMASMSALKVDLIDDMLGLQPQPMALEVNDGVAVIQVCGALGRRLPEWAKQLMDMYDVDDLMSLLSQAESREDVAAVVLDMDSPGGSCDGIIEAANIVAGMTKPVVVNSTMTCSAAYWIASQADEILVMPSSVTGNVGVYMAVPTDAAEWAMSGYKQNLYKAGAVKAIGVPGVDITEPQAAHLQSQVDYIYGRFSAAVRSARPLVKPEHLQGQDYLGEQAIEAGLADSLGDLNQAIADARALAGLRTN